MGHGLRSLQPRKENVFCPFFLKYIYLYTYSFPGGSDGKESAHKVGDPGLLPGLRRSPGEGNSNAFSFLAQRIPWTEEPGGLNSMGSQRIRHE